MQRDRNAVAAFDDHRRHAGRRVNVGRLDEDGVGVAAFAEAFLRHGQRHLDVQFVALEHAAQLADAQRRPGERDDDLAGAAEFEAVLVGLVGRPG